MDGLGEVLQQSFKRASTELQLLSSSSTDLQFPFHWCMMTVDGWSVSQGEQRAAQDG